MSLHYILDGYNILKKLPDITSRTLKGGREGLLRHIRNRRPQGKNSVTVVFDGSSDVWHFSGPKDIEVVFSKNDSADEEIKRIVRNAQNPKVSVVVTDDRQLQFAVRSLGAKVRSVEEFLSPARHQPRSKGQTYLKSPLPEDLARRITKELEAIWLKEKQAKRSQ